MNKLRKARIHSFEGLDFEVDIDKQVFRQINNPEHEISFITQMTDLGDHYMLAFDTITKTAVHGDHDPKAIRPIIIPPLSELDPEGMAAKYGVSVELLKGKKDFEIIVDPEALELRRQGVLPVVNIAGDDFVFDLRLQELRHKENFHPVISMASLDLTSDGWHYEAFYHPYMKQIVSIDRKLLEFPDGVIKIKLPNELVLDPVGTARQYQMNEYELLRRYPIQKELKAELISLAETDIPRLIRRNKEALQEAHRENTQKIKPHRRPKF